MKEKGNHLVARIYGDMFQGGDVSEFSQSTATRGQLQWGLLGVRTNMGDRLKQRINSAECREVNF